MSSLPVPAPTDPMADAALHIRNLAESVTARLAGTAVVAFDSGDQKVNAQGSIYAGTVSGLASVSGVVMGAVRPNLYSGGQTSDSMYVPGLMRDPGAGAQMWFKCTNPPTGETLVGKYARVCGLAYGPPAAAAARPTANPGDTFPAGVTGRGLHYPGTDDPQYRTAAAIGQLADDAGAALVVAPTGLKMATWVGVGIVSGTAGVITLDFRDKLAFVRGLVCTPWDASGAYWEARVTAAFNFTEPDTVPGTIRVRCCTNDGQSNADIPYARPIPNGGGIGLAAFAWGD